MNGGRKHRDKGNRLERDIVDRHKAIGVHAERYPLSGASNFRGSSHDIDLYVFHPDEAPLVAEVKGRKSGKGFAVLESWLGDYDLLFLKRNNADPLVTMPWRIWERLARYINECERHEFYKENEGGIIEDNRPEYRHSRDSIIGG